MSFLPCACPRLPSPGADLDGSAVRRAQVVPNTRLECLSSHEGLRRFSCYQGIARNSSSRFCTFFLRRRTALSLHWAKDHGHADAKDAEKAICSTALGQFARDDVVKNQLSRVQGSQVITVMTLAHCHPGTLVREVGRWRDWHLHDDTPCLAAKYIHPSSQDAH